MTTTASLCLHSTFVYGGAGLHVPCDLSRIPGVQVFFLSKGPLRSLSSTPGGEQSARWTGCYHDQVVGNGHVGSADGLNRMAIGRTDTMHRRLK